MYVFINLSPPLHQLMFASHHSLSSGYSRFPIHQPGKPMSFVGLLLVKKVCLSVVILASHPTLLLLTVLGSYCHTTPQKLSLYPLSNLVYYQRRSLLSTVSKLWITCASICPAPLYVCADDAEAMIAKQGEHICY